MQVRSFFMLKNRKLYNILAYINISCYIIYKIKKKGEIKMEKAFNDITYRGLKVGVRVIPHGEEAEIGEVLRNSFEHDYEKDISSYHSGDPVELDGACAIEVDYDWEDEDYQLFLSEIQRSLDYAKSLYQGQQIVLIGGEDYSWGDDDKEVIIEEAEVLHVFK